MNKRFLITMTAGTAVLVVFAVIAMGMGQFYIPASEMVKILLHQGSSINNAETVVYNVRIPRIVMSMVAGAGLAAGGAAFQSLFANPLATPDTLGTANGASFGAALAILLGMNAMGVQLCALLFGILAVLLVFTVTKSSENRKSSIVMVILAGMVVSSLFSALVSLVKFAADPQDVLPVITFWLMGSFSGITMKGLYVGLPLILGGTFIIWLLRFRLNALSLSEEEAMSLGINIRRVRAIVVASGAAVTASTVALCGVIGWVGLLVPHIARMIAGNDNRRVVPVSIVFGALFMLITDTAARCMTASEIPVSILTAVIGAPVFILLLRRTGGIRA